MATFKSSLITKQDAARTGLRNGILDGDDQSGVLLYATATYTLLGTEAAADIIDLVDLPKGAVLVPQLSHVICTDPGTALVIDIGDAADTDRYANDIVLSAGGLVGFCSATQPDAAINPLRTTTQTRVYATIGTATALTAAVKLAFTIAYRVKA